MKTFVLGDGEPEYAVVSGVHGDEPAGVKAVQKLKESSKEFLKPLKLVIANEKALDRNERFVEKDLNRVFPGDSEGCHEERLAASLYSELEGMKVIDLHTTSSEKTPFTVVSNPGEEELELAAATGVKRTIDMSFVQGGLDDDLTAVVAEAERGERAVEELYKVLENFLINEEVVAGDAERSEPEIFKVYGVAEGEGFRFTAENFEKVSKGEAFAKKEDHKLVAQKDFYPVLMSTDGYEDMVGFQANKRKV